MRQNLSASSRAELTGEFRRFIGNTFPHIQDDIIPLIMPPERSCLHISTNKKIDKFIPMVSNRTMKEEDRSIPRICGALSLWGCMAGYLAIFRDFFNQPEGYGGGYYIYRLPVSIVGQPSKELVPDAEFTKEVWVVGINAKHVVVEPTIIGELFAGEILSSGDHEGRTLLYNFYLKIDEPLEIVDGQVLESGYHQFTLEGKGDSFTPMKSIECVSISEKKYLAARSKSAKGLSCEGYPPSSEW